jgi:hypothetical protein
VVKKVVTKVKRDFSYYYRNKYGIIFKGLIAEVEPADNDSCKWGNVKLDKPSRFVFLLLFWD